jgi:CRP/FNR family cyclic AMP-dependent transcriptional regulator
MWWNTLATRGILCEFGAGETIIQQGASDNSIFFILVGTANVHVNGKHVATRNSGEVLGELALADVTAPRSATVKAGNQLTALKIDEPTFSEVSRRFPALWKALTILVGEKLRERDAAIRPANAMPILFVGSSVEGLAVARQIQSALKHEPMDVRLWTDSVFTASSVTIDALMEQAETADFALFVFGPDDRIASRTKEYEGPRDNVIFELGLFMGKLTRTRTFFVMQHASDLKIPTDLFGITPIMYVHHPGANLASALGPVCTELLSRIKVLGVKST